MKVIIRPSKDIFRNKCKGTVCKCLVKTQRGRFSNSLHQSKPSLGVKTVLTVIYADECIEYAFVGDSLSDTKFMGGEH